MTEPVDPANPPTVSAGTLIRQARMAQGLHIAALAAAIKVSPRKLELLETDRFDALPDATFVRALAHTVCRQLKIDSEPVLSRLPQAMGHRLEHVNRGLGQRFHDRPGTQLPSDASLFTRPIVWGPALILLAALVVYLLPPGLTRQFMAPAASAPAAAPAPVPPPAAASAPSVGDLVAPATTAAASPPAVVVETVHSAPTTNGEAAAAVPAGLLVVRATGESWVEVIDSRGQPLLSRTVQPGESVGLDGAPPLKVRIGNASATQLTFRGQPVDLAPATRDNIARLDLK